MRGKIKRLVHAAGTVRALGKQDSEAGAWEVRWYAAALREPTASQPRRHAVTPHYHRQLDGSAFQPTPGAVVPEWQDCRHLFSGVRSVECISV
jgi:hypothetical protein